MKTRIKHPPKIAYWLLKLFTSDWKNISLIGDLEEEFFDIAESKGFTYARLWYVMHVLKSIPKLIKDSNSWGIFMFKNYLTIAWRNLKKYKAFSLINISGLAIGIAACLLLILYINSELSYDIHHEKVDRIFRVCNHAMLGDFESDGGASNALIKDALLSNYPEVENGTRFRRGRLLVKYGNQSFNDSFIYTDESALDIFTWPMLKGDVQTALSAPNTIVLTKSTAEKYFGNEDPLNKIVSIDDEQFTITGVVADNPRYNSFPFNGLISFSTFYKSADLPMILTDWTSHNFDTFILLKPGVDYKEFNRKIKDIYQEYASQNLADMGGDIDIWLQPYRDIYLRPIGNETGPMTYVYILSAVAFFVLLIACVNFMNLSTARSINRAKEVGMRKVMGANKGKLINQFLAEALLLSFISLFIALVIAYLALPKMSELVGRDLLQDVLDLPWLLPMILGFTILVGLIAGSYPAFYLSKFQPVEIMQNKLTRGKSGNRFRKILVVVQFSISTVLIIGTALIMEQLHFLKTLDPGFDKERLMVIHTNNEESQNAIPTLEEEFRKNPNVISVGAASSMPLWGSPLNAKIPEGFSDNDNQIMAELNVDAGYIPTCGIKIMKGRNFLPDSPSDQFNSVIVNETAVERYDWDNPIGKTIKSRDPRTDFQEWATLTVIGVVKDYNISSLTDEIRPLFIGNFKNHPARWGQFNGMLVKLRPEDTYSTLEYIEETWEKILPGVPFYNYFIDEIYDNQFNSIDQSREIFSYFTLLAIFIACLGLFGMSSFVAEKKTREIGIRKVLGGSVYQVVALLTKELLLPVAAACAIAYPIAYLLISEWLESFPYKMEIGISTFIICTVLALVISFLTVAFQSIKAARANPVESLRSK